YTGWTANTTPTQAVGELLLFSHNSLDPQLLLAGAVVVGLIGFRRLGDLRWIAGSAALFGLLYLAVAISDHPLVMAIARPWWDDKFRLVAMAGLAMCVLAGHGIAEVQRVLRDLGGRFAPRVAGALAAYGDRARFQRLRILGEVARWMSGQLELAELDSSKARLVEAEMRALRAQISPHFVYNSLTTIASFVRTDPERARELVLDFADFARYSFRNPRDFTTLAEELRSIDRY
ncbi:DUF6541 family protein, partial [Streptomonospora nanhaiensis]|uniref:DUF6541 family protein n=1 Tax=Streptomonospora nanhaiensis TaxID=1323731 RepID=UPI003610866E